MLNMMVFLYFPVVSNAKTWIKSDPRWKSTWTAIFCNFLQTLMFIPSQLPFSYMVQFRILEVVQWKCRNMMTKTTMTATIMMVRLTASTSKSSFMMRFPQALRLLRLLRECEVVPSRSSSRFHHLHKHHRHDSFNWGRSNGFTLPLEILALGCLALFCLPLMQLSSWSSP